MPIDNSRNVILTCALTLFSSHGYNGTGIQDITAAAGITKPTLYYFFKSKDGLYEALWKEQCTPLITALAKTCHYVDHISEYELDVYGQLTKIADVLFSFASSNPEFYRLMVNAQSAPPESTECILAHQYLEKIESQIESFFSEASLTHGNMSGKHHQYAVTFIALITAYMWLAASAPEQASAASLVKQFMHGIFS